MNRKGILEGNSSELPPDFHNMVNYLNKLGCYTRKSNQIHFGSYSGEHNVVSGALRALNCSKIIEIHWFSRQKITFFYDEKSPEKKGDFCQKSPLKKGDLKSEKKHYVLIRPYAIDFHVSARVKWGGGRNIHQKFAKNIFLLIPEISKFTVPGPFYTLTPCSNHHFPWVNSKSTKLVLQTKQ